VVTKQGHLWALSDLLCFQRLGECLGKGAFGSVYKAFNWGTGEAVAVKQIRIADLPRSELRNIEVCLEVTMPRTKLTLAG
jgi:serine/threonine protein kinase